MLLSRLPSLDGHCWHAGAHLAENSWKKTPSTGVSSHSITSSTEATTSTPFKTGVVPKEFAKISWWLEASKQSDKISRKTRVMAQIPWQISWKQPWQKQFSRLLPWVMIWVFVRFARTLWCAKKAAKRWNLFYCLVILSTPSTRSVIINSLLTTKELIRSRCAPCAELRLTRPRLMWLITSIPTNLRLVSQSIKKLFGRRWQNWTRLSFLEQIRILSSNLLRKPCLKILNSYSPFNTQCMILQPLLDLSLTCQSVMNTSCPKYKRQASVRLTSQLSQFKWSQLKFNMTCHPPCLTRTSPKTLVL